LLFEFGCPQVRHVQTDDDRRCLVEPATGRRARNPLSTNESEAHEDLTGNSEAAASTQLVVPAKTAACRLANSAKVVGLTPNSSCVPSSTCDWGWRSRSSACSMSASTTNGGRPAASIPRRCSSILVL